MQSVLERLRQQQHGRLGAKVSEVPVTFSGYSEASLSSLHTASELYSRVSPVRHHKETGSVGKGMPCDGGDLSVHKVFTDR